MVNVYMSEKQLYNVVFYLHKIKDNKNAVLFI